MVYCELGRLPLYVERQCKMVKYWTKLLNTKNCILKGCYDSRQSEIPLPSDGIIYFCQSRGTSESYTYGKQRICLSDSWSAHFHVSWLSDFIFYQKPLYKSLHQSFFYSFITILPSHDFALDPIIPPFDFHFRIYKRDLAIITE